VPLAVIAIGGNSLTLENQVGTIDEQFANARRACAHIATLIERGWSVVLTHGNGPQVGSVLERVELGASRGIYRLPLDICDADTEGGIGYMLQQVLGNELRARGLARTVVTLITQTRVDPSDPAFQSPDKPIGPFFVESAARIKMRELGWNMREDAGRGWRRVVPSPRPLEIIEADAVRRCIDQGLIPIAAGGGGVPVVEKSARCYSGVEAVVDKDRASALLAHMLGADVLLITTGVHAVQVGFRTAEARELEEVERAELRRYLEEGEFPAGSMLPKIEAALSFVDGAPGKRFAVITDPESVVEAAEGRAGTRVR
jgi:carbamate kinase